MLTNTLWRGSGLLLLGLLLVGFMWSGVVRGSAAEGVLLTPTASATVTAWATAPPAPSPMLTVAVACGEGSWQVSVVGEGWYRHEPLALFANGRLRHTLVAEQTETFSLLLTLVPSERPLTITVAQAAVRQTAVLPQPCGGGTVTYLPYTVQAGPTPNAADAAGLAVQPSCLETLSEELTVSGTGWLPEEEVALFWNGRLQAIVEAPHADSFTQTWPVTVQQYQNRITALSPSSSSWLFIFHPCPGTATPFPTPTIPGGPTATPCGEACPPPPTPTPCQVGCPATATEEP